MTHDPTQPYTGQGLPRQAFRPYRPPSVVWEDFKTHWSREHAGKPLPSLGTLSLLTGIHPRTLRRLRAQDNHTVKTKP